MVQDMAEGRPPATLFTADGTEVDAVTRQPVPQAGQDLHGPTELSAGLTPQAVGRSGARLFAPATQSTPGIQGALNTLDGETRGAAARIDTMVGRGQLTQDVGNGLYQKTKFDGYRQFLNDVANSPDGVAQKGAGVTRPAGWKDGANFGTELSNTWLAPETATVVENIRDQVNGSTLADAVNAVNRPFSLLKEATLGGSTYHLAQEAWQTVRLTRQNAPAVLARSVVNAADPSGKLFQTFRRCRLDHDHEDARGRARRPDARSWRPGNQDRRRRNRRLRQGLSR
jgi:hypothetical protein